MLRCVSTVKCLTLLQNSPGKPNNITVLFITSEDVGTRNNIEGKPNNIAVLFIASDRCGGRQIKSSNSEARTQFHGRPDYEPETIAPC